MKQVTRLLAQFLVKHPVKALPQGVRHEATRAVLNWVGCAIGGSRHDTAKRSLAALSPFSGLREASVLGRAERVDIFQAALLNGTNSHTFDFDDTHIKSVIHPSAPVAAAILALAEHQKVSGEDFIHAFVLGVETECRIGMSINPDHYDKGWHITGTAGVLGAAAAVGRLLRLNEQQMVWALGIAATQACGIRESFGSMTKPLHPGLAARNGLMAALLAKKNLTSAEAGIEGRRGFAAVYSTHFDPDQITKGLGKTWEISSNSYKPYACGVVIHPAIDGCLQLQKQYRLRFEDIVGIHLQVHPLVLELTGNKRPQSGLAGKFSVFHSCAAALWLKAGTEAAYADRLVVLPKITRLRDRVSATVTPGIAEDQVRIRMQLKDGRTLNHFVEHALGSVHCPMSDEDLELKFKAQTKGFLPAQQIQSLIDLCWNSASLKQASQIARAAVPKR